MKWFPGYRIQIFSVNNFSREKFYFYPLYMNALTLTSLKSVQKKLRIEVFSETKVKPKRIYNGALILWHRNYYYQRKTSTLNGKLCEVKSSTVHLTGPTMQCKCRMTYGHFGEIPNIAVIAQWSKICLFNRFSHWIECVNAMKCKQKTAKKYS